MQTAKHIKPKENWEIMSQSFRWMMSPHKKYLKLSDPLFRVPIPAGKNWLTNVRK